MQNPLTRTAFLIVILIISFPGVFIFITLRHSAPPQLIYIGWGAGLLAIGIAWIKFSSQLKGKFNKILGTITILTAVAFSFFYHASSPGFIKGIREAYLMNLGYLLALIFWWKFSSSSKGIYNRAISYTGIGILAIMTISITFSTAPFVMNSFRGIPYQNKLALENFNETYIRWPGFENPVGLHLEMDLIHPKDMQNRSGFNIRPMLWMGEFEKSFYWSAYETYYYYFTRASYQRLDTETQILKYMTTHDSNFSEIRLSGTEKTHFAFDLLPKNLMYFENPETLCFNHNFEKMKKKLGYSTVYFNGKDLSSLWYLEAQNLDGERFKVDLSPILTRALRENSSLQGKPADWKGMQRQLEFAELRTKGYQPCEVKPIFNGKRSKNAYTSKFPCFCKPLEKKE